MFTFQQKIIWESIAEIFRPYAMNCLQAYDHLKRTYFCYLQRIMGNIRQRHVQTFQATYSNVIWDAQILTDERRWE